MNTIPIPRASTPKAVYSAIILMAIFTGLLYNEIPAGAGYTNEHMEAPYDDDGHPRSWIRITGNCENLLYCETRYKIQYSYWGWRTSGNSEVIVTPNSNTWTGANATCNKSPGTYRGRMDMKLVNDTQITISVSVGGNGGTISIPAQTTYWISSSSPHTTGFECDS